MRRLLRSVLVASALLCVLASPAASASWHFETLDGAGGADGRINANVGRLSAVTLYGGQPHVWYHGDRTLRHAWWDGTHWLFETLDGLGGSDGRINANVGVSSAVTLYAGQPHVWYGDRRNGDLRHAWWDGTRWLFETLDGAGGADGRINADVGRSSAVTLYAGQPHVWYHGDRTLRHAWWDGTHWLFETLDGAGGSDGRINANVGRSSAVTLYAGQPHVWYRDRSNGDLRHARWDGTHWLFETLDGAGGSDGRINADVGDTSAVTLYAGQPHAWYYGDRTLRHAWWDGTHWLFETLDGAGGADGRINANVGDASAVTLYAGQPHAWYYDNRHGDLRHAWWDGTHWLFETLDGAGGSDGRINVNVGSSSAVTLFAGEPHAWYYDNRHGDLRHAWWD